MAAQAKEEWEKAMTELAQEEPELLQHFQKLSEAAGNVGKTDLFFAGFFCYSSPPCLSRNFNALCAFASGTDTASQQEFTSCLKETLRGLAKNADNLQVSQVRKERIILKSLGGEKRKIFKSCCFLVVLGTSWR